MALSKLTDYEIEALQEKYNFADGHARNPFPWTLMSKVGEAFQDLAANPWHDQRGIEQAFGEEFFGLAGQAESVDLGRVLYCPSASVSIEIVANYLRSKNYSVTLAEPTFDNLADILRRHSVSLEPLQMEQLSTVDFDTWLGHVTSDALFLVLPNNPTGHVLSEADFTRVVDFCVLRNKLLILDLSFRFFGGSLIDWNQYAHLESSGVRYITIEDTGKTWPTVELKVSPLTADLDTFNHLGWIYRDIFMCLSPLAFTLVRDFIHVSHQHGLHETVWRTVEENRRALRSVLAGSVLRPVGQSNVSVEWVEIMADLDDLEVEAVFKAQGIFVLPGRHFYWSGSVPRDKHIRIALMRGTDIFGRGMEVLQRALPVFVAKT